MKTISLKVSDKTDEAFNRMSKDELDKLSEKLELYISNPVDELLILMDGASEYAKQKGLTAEKLAEILEIDKDEMNRTFGRE